MALHLKIDTFVRLQPSAGYQSLCARHIFRYKAPNRSPRSPVGRGPQPPTPPQILRPGASYHAPDPSGKLPDTSAAGEVKDGKE